MPITHTDYVPILKWRQGEYQALWRLADTIKERTVPLADNDYEATLKRVHKAIADAGSAGIDGNKLSRRTQGVDRRKRIEILAHLEEAGMIRVMEMAKSEGARGPARRVYFDVA